VTHFLMMILFAAFVSVVFGTIGRDTPKERMTYGLRVFGEFLAIGFILSWLLYLLPV
jgi:hypothetical protein